MSVAASRLDGGARGSARRRRKTSLAIQKIFYRPSQIIEKSDYLLFEFSFPNINRPEIFPEFSTEK